MHMYDHKQCVIQNTNTHVQTNARTHYNLYTVAGRAIGNRETTSKSPHKNRISRRYKNPPRPTKDGQNEGGSYGHCGREPKYTSSLEYHTIKHASCTEVTNGSYGGGGRITFSGLSRPEVVGRRDEDECHKRQEEIVERSPLLVVLELHAGHLPNTVYLPHLRRISQYVRK